MSSLILTQQNMVVKNNSTRLTAKQEKQSENNLSLNASNTEPVYLKGSSNVVVKSKSKKKKLPASSINGGLVCEESCLLEKSLKPTKKSLEVGNRSDAKRLCSKHTHIHNKSSCENERLLQKKHGIHKEKPEFKQRNIKTQHAICNKTATTSYHQVMGRNKRNKLCNKNSNTQEVSLNSNQKTSVSNESSDDYNQETANKKVWYKIQTEMARNREELECSIQKNQKETGLTLIAEDKPISLITETPPLESFISSTLTEETKNSDSIEQTEEGTTGKKKRRRRRRRRKGLLSDLKKQPSKDPKDQLPPELKTLFQQKYQLTDSEIFQLEFKKELSICGRNQIQEKPIPTQYRFDFNTDIDDLDGLYQERDRNLEFGICMKKYLFELSFKTKKTLKEIGEQNEPTVLQETKNTGNDLPIKEKKPKQLKNGQSNQHTDKYSKPSKFTKKNTNNTLNNKSKVFKPTSVKQNIYEKIDLTKELKKQLKENQCQSNGSPLYMEKIRDQESWCLKAKK